MHTDRKYGLPRVFFSPKLFANSNHEEEQVSKALDALVYEISEKEHYMGVLLGNKVLPDVTRVKVEKAQDDRLSIAFENRQNKCIGFGIIDPKLFEFVRIFGQETFGIKYAGDERYTYTNDDTPCNYIDVIMNPFHD